MAQAKAGEDAEGAFATALQDARTGDRGYATVACAQARSGNLGDALVTIAGGDDWAARASGYIAVAGTQIRTERFADGISCIRRAIEIERNVSECGWDESVAERAVAAVGACTRDSDEIVGVVMSLAAIGHEWTRWRALGKLAIDFAVAGRSTEALRIAASINDEKARSEAMRTIARELAEAGQFSDAVLAANSIQGMVYYETSTQDSLERYATRLRALCSIAKLQVNAGLGPESTLIEALNAAEGSDDVDWLCKLARVQVLARKNPGEMLNKVLTIAAASMNEWGSARIKHDVAMVYIFGKYFTKAKEVAVNIQDSHKRSATLCVIAKAQAQASLFFEALDTAESIEKAEYRSKAKHGIAKAYANKGLIEDALAIYEQVTTDQSKLLEDFANPIEALPSEARKTALRAYLPRAAYFVGSAWISCVMLARLFPDRINDFMSMIHVYCNLQRETSDPENLMNVHHFITF